MATYPLPTLGPTIGPTGISAPSYADILASLKASAQSIFGPDVYLEADSQDGQLLAIFAKAQSDQNDAAIAAYNSMSPQTAIGAGLSSRVKLNGLARNVASNSQATVVVTGQVGAVITNGLAADTTGNLWALPASVTIPTAGFINVTATCQTPGAIAAAPHTITSIATPQLGWQSVDNVASASPGAPIETDPQLKARQAASVALPSLSITDGVVAAVKALTGVTEVEPYENDTGATDANGIPAHSLSLVVTGGDTDAVANAINLKKGPGAGTYGNTAVTVTDVSGIPKIIHFYRPTNVPITVQVAIHALAGYSSTIGTQIKQALVDYVASTLATGDDVLITRLYVPAQLYGGVGSETYELTTVLAAISPGTPGSSDLVMALYQKATLALADISLVVT